ncbi:tetratricopeptide repeat protein [Nonomuraea fuscirosea]|uniref:tetratricopeptide repeat protein n=1 Tax=Nonomuraea fuscirosea TaxID=1291556 RepID=UPI0034318160
MGTGKPAMKAHSAGDAPRIILQDIRQFTVQIRDPDGKRVIGTGVVISRGGLIATCAHVVRAAGVEPRVSRQARVVVYLPKTGRGPGASELRSAWVIACFSDSDDDLVCLQVDGPLPLPMDRVAVLGAAGDSYWHDFRSYGYRQLGDYLGAWARGVILGEVDPPASRRLLLNPVQLESKNIDAGMSGAAVLDVERNLVVGVVTETWIAELAGKDRDTAWAVNAGLLDLSPLRVDLRSDPLPLVEAQPARVRPALADRARPRVAARHMDFAPLPLPEWVSRDTALQQLGESTGEDHFLVVSLVGFGGEGKTSIARRWVDHLSSSIRGEQFSVFWWSFTERASADDFLEAALDFVSGGAISPEELPDGRARAECVAGLLDLHPYLFVLDGFEVMQHQDGDNYGSVKSTDLRDFLTFFATPDHHSFCLITTRAPVFDLVPYVTHHQVDVEPLETEQGKELLRNLGIFGSDASLEQVVRDWGGHALTLSLVAAYLASRHGGDARRVTSLPKPHPDLPRDALVRRVLQEYDACLSDEERTLLVRYSVFRTPVSDDALRLILPDTPWEEASEEWQQARTAIFRHLVAARIVRRDASGRTVMHPLVRDYFASRAADDEDRRALHRRAMNYYLSTAPSATAGRHTLEDLAEVVEAVHHACRASIYDTACDIVHDQLYEGERGLITRELNAYESALAVFADFYPGGALIRHPLVPDGASRGWIQHEVATCLQMLGRLREAAMATRRATQAFKAVGAWHDAAVSCQNMAELQLSLGALPSCRLVVAEAFNLARRAADEEDVLVAETLRGALAHLQGRTQEAGEAFAEALRIARAHTPIPALYSSSGIRYADYLRRLGRADEARRVHGVNLEVCRAAGWRGDEAMCLSGLGDLALDANDPDGARQWYDRSLRIARGITRRDVLIGALMGQARWRLRFGSTTPAAIQELKQALVMAVAGGYRLAEIEVHLLMAETYGRLGDFDAAWESTNYGEQMSIEIGYHWGQERARDVTLRLEEGV